VHVSDVRRERRAVVGSIAVLVVIALLVAVDLIADSDTGVTMSHLALEAGAFVLSLGAAGLLVVRLRSLLHERRKLRGELHASREDAQRWRTEARDLLGGLGSAIDRQFVRWELTPAEREVAMLLLKGLSLRDIASMRGVSERTVRQQAHTLYGKAGLEGRADLAAFFLEGLWLPE
jgi:DNA-binding NarL/FixJ family response regulator